MNVEQEIRELRRRVDQAEASIARLAGSFEFISGQLRDVQTYMHARFAEVDERFDAVDEKLAAHDRRFDVLEEKVDALPRAIAEMIAER
jgi:phage shock protein A